MARFVLACVVAAGCAGQSTEAPPPETSARTTKNGDTTITFSQGVVQPPAPGTSVDLSTFEIRADESDHFVHCPPSTDLGQGWIPPLPEWKPPAGANTDAPAPQPQEMQGQLPLTRTEKALEDTRLAFRDCYHRGLVHDPTQAGHAAVVLRLDPQGTVARAETYGACGLQAEVLRCMKEVGGRLHFASPAAGDETVVLPVVFAPRSGTPRYEQANDGYTAAAFLALEALRPQLHACEKSARNSGRRMDAFGTFTIEIDAQGSGGSITVDPYGGEQAILSCAAEVVQRIKLAPPQGGRATLIARLTFNPRH